MMIQFGEGTKKLFFIYGVEYSGILCLDFIDFGKLGRRQI
jgi:hypothetical protein